MERSPPDEFKNWSIVVHAICTPRMTKHQRPKLMIAAGRKRDIP
jgi:hypothetical protein